MKRDWSGFPFAPYYYYYCYLLLLPLSPFPFLPPPPPLLLLLRREVGGTVGEGHRESLKQASMPSAEPDLTTLRSWPGVKSRIRCLTRSDQMLNQMLNLSHPGIPAPSRLYLFCFGPVRCTCGPIKLLTCPLASGWFGGFAAPAGGSEGGRAEPYFHI